MSDRFKEFDEFDETGNLIQPDIGDELKKLTLTLQCISEDWRSDIRSFKEEFSDILRDIVPGDDYE